MLAVVSGASTAGECAAAGMQTRCAPSRLAIRSCAAGRPGVVVLAVQHQDRRAARLGQRRRLVRAGEQVLAHRDQALGGVAQHPLAQERDDRRGHARRRWPAARTWTPRARGSAPRGGPGPVLVSSASIARSTVARCPRRLPGPEPSRVSELILAVPGQHRLPRDQAAEGVAEQVHAAAVRPDRGGDAGDVGGERVRPVRRTWSLDPGVSYCPRMSIATTRRPAAASGCSTVRKSSLLPV